MQLAELALQGRWKRAWLLGQWSYQITHSAKIGGAHLGSLLSNLSENLIPNQLWHGEELSDIAGAISSDGEATPICLQVTGEMRINDNEWEEFNYTLRTPFSEFKGIHHIIHHGEEVRTSSLPNLVSGSRLGKLIPLKINSFSIGLQYYESRHTIFLGYNPTPTAELLISAKNGVLIFNFILEQQKSKDPALVKKHPAIESLRH